MATEKELGTKAFTAKDYDKAIEHFTNAIKENPSDHTLYSNRSLSYYNKQNYQKALEDGEECIKVKPDFGKGYQRKGMPLQALGKYEEALQAYEEGLKYDPENAQMKQFSQQCKDQLNNDADPMFGPQAMAKLMSNPRTAGFFADPQFRNMFELGKKNPQLFMQLAQSDPRFMEVFSVLTGIDLMGMKEQQMKQKDQDEETKKKLDEIKKKKEEEEAKRKKEEEEAALPDEEKQKIEKRKKADAKKNEGNAAYKAKDFEKALALYQEAIDTDDTEITYYTNKAAVYFEMKEYDKCIEECDKAIKRSSEGFYDYQKLGKAIARKANATLQKGQYEEAIDLYNKALLEFNDSNIRDQLKKAQRLHKEDEERKLIDPEKAEEYRKKGNELFEQGNFPGAVKEYTEGLRRDPKSKAIYSNRCAAYIKLMEFTYALKDAEKCLEIDPNFVKAYYRKGNCHHLMKEYHKAMEAFDKGLKIDPDNKECKEGKMKTTMAISSGAYGGQNDEERVRHAMADPEIQMLLRDPRIQQVLKDMQENPASAQGAMRDPFISEALNKLIAAGVLKMG